MIELEVSSQIDQIINALAEIPSQVAKPSIARALNRSATSSRKRAIKEVKEYMGVKPGAIKENIKIRKANAKKLAAILNNRGKRLNLARFKGKQVKRGVRATTYGTTRIYNHAFLINGGKTAMTRTTANRYPIRPLYGPGIVSSLIREGVYPRMQDFTAAEFERILFKEVQFRMDKLGLPVPERFRKV